VGDPVVIRNINVGQGTNTFRIDGHQTYWEPRYRDAQGVESSPIDTIHTAVSEKFTLILKGGAGGPNHVAGDYLYHDGENRRFESGAWGILRVLPSLEPSLKQLPGFGTRPAQLPACPTGAPVHPFAISAVDLPSTAAGGGRDGRKAAFVRTVQAAAVRNRQIFPEPLILHAAAGECVQVTFRNERAAEAASFHVGAVLHDLASSGVNVGTNAGNQAVPPGGTRTYTYYADTHKLESTTISDFGGNNGPWDGLYGSLVVAPAGSTFTDPRNALATDVGSIVDVHVPGQPDYRDFTVILADQDPRIGQDTMPYPRDVSGPALINYRQVLGRALDANTFSSATHGDPTTPLLRAYAGDPVKVHVLGAPASEQVHVFTLGGMSWPSDMYVHDASQFQSRAVGPWEKMDLLVSGGAGGVTQQPGDYLYGDIRRPFTEAGMWGLFRVLPNTCPTGGTFGLVCLEPPPSDTNTPATGTVTISDTTPTEGQALGVTSVLNDADGINTSTLVQTWEAQAGPTTWSPVGTGATFTPDDAQVGLALRVVVTFDDLFSPPAHESITSEATGPVANVNDVPTGPVVSPALPQEAELVMADPTTIVDGDGLVGVTFSFQWQQRLGAAAFANIAGAISPTLLPAQAQVGRSLRVVATFTDNHGTPETASSAPTGVVGDLFGGTAGIDTFAGTAGRDNASGLGGNDSLSGAGADDVLSGDAGDDTINGGAGNDLIRFNVGDGFDAVTGGAGIDQIQAQAANTVIGLSSLASVESITANGFSGVTIQGSAGANVLNFNAVTLAGIVSIDGGLGTDTITGNNVAADVLLGGAGADTVNGGGGADTITGGADNDTMNGGAGPDTFKFAALFGADFIAGFDANPTGGQDKLDISALGITAATFAANVTIAAGPLVGTTQTTLVTIVGGGTIQVNGVAFPGTVANRITIDDFILFAP
jgi:Ca2+-binding RTX toxin-like protein